MDVADDVLEGESLKSSVKKRIPQGIKRTASDVDWQTGSGILKRRKTRDALSYRTMAFVHEQSCECTKSELGLFSVPPTQTSMESGNWIEYHRLTSVADGSPIEF